MTDHTTAAQATKQETVLTDAMILHRWACYVSDPSAAYPLTDADKIAFARAIESALLSKLRDRKPDLTASRIAEQHIDRIRELEAEVAKLRAPVDDERSLPPLPPMLATIANWKSPTPGEPNLDVYSAEQMRAYARAAQASAPVAGDGKTRVPGDHLGGPVVAWDDGALSIPNRPESRADTGSTGGALAPVAGEAVAWMKEDGSDAWTDQKKRDAVKYAGAPGVKIAESYNVPLFRHAAPQASEAVRQYVPPEKPLPDLMMASYHEAIGWNACRAVMLQSAALSAQPGAQKEQGDAE